MPRNSAAIPPQNQPTPAPDSSVSSVSDDRVDADYLASTAAFSGHIHDDAQASEGKKTEEQKVADIIPPELVKGALKPTFNALFNGIAKQRGEHWKLETFEENALVEGWTPIVSYLLAKLGSTEQTLLILALGSTVAIVGGKIAQDATQRASSTASIKTPESVASPASSASVTVASQPAHGPSFEMPAVA